MDSLPEGASGFSSLIETFEKCPILFEFKEGNDCNRKNTFGTDAEIGKIGHLWMGTSNGCFGILSLSM